jgi:hypothetical protein
MSPTSKELVSNRPLAGTELAAIIESDIHRMVSESGFLAGQSAYSRIAYDIRVTLHLDLPAMPTAVEVTQSRPAPAIDTDHAAMEPFPLSDSSPESILTSSGLSREITSPNLARVEHSLPVTVDVLGGDGHTREELVQYRPIDVGMQAEDFTEPEIVDKTAEVRREIGGFTPDNLL